MRRISLSFLLHRLLVSKPRLVPVNRAAGGHSGRYRGLELSQAVELDLRLLLDNDEPRDE